MNRWQRSAWVILAGDLAIFIGTAGTADHWVYAATGCVALLLAAAGAYGQPRLRIVNVALAAIAALLAIHLYVPPGVVSMDFAPSPVTTQHGDRASARNAP